MPARWRSVFQAAVIVAALGYFVDIYDLVLFGIVRVASLKELGVSDADVFDKGVLLLNAQMAGMLIGGIAWGILGDKRGRLSILFGSIILYSLANIANGLVHDVGTYGVMRFFAGLGLAGELGAGITLVSEVLPTAARGLGTTVVASVGILGAVLANLIANHVTWRTAYFIGGGLGFALLVLRVSVVESGMFHAVRQNSDVRRGDFFSLFRSRPRFVRYLRCIVIGLPIWFVTGVPILFAPEFAKALGVQGPVTAGNAVMFSYLGLAAGDFCSGLLSQLARSRKRVVALFIGITTAALAWYLLQRGATVPMFHAACLGCGFGIGYWAVFVTTAAEQFGTNLRATVTTTAPNFVRGAVVPITALFSLLKPATGILAACALVGALCIGAALLALRGMEETFGKDLDFTEAWEPVEAGS
jgi:MFS transporter, putative metabolite:H+ symporter